MRVFDCTLLDFFNSDYTVLKLRTQYQMCVHVLCVCGGVPLSALLREGHLLTAAQHICYDQTQDQIHSSHLSGVPFCESRETLQSCVYHTMVGLWNHCAKVSCLFLRGDYMRMQYLCFLSFCGLWSGGRGIWWCMVALNIPHFFTEHIMHSKIRNDPISYTPKPIPTPTPNSILFFAD